MDAVIKHLFHSFRMLRRTIQRSETTFKWTERCKCGSTVVVEAEYDLTNKTPTVKKSWFDSDGNFVKVTGSAQNILVHEQLSKMAG